MGAVPVLMLGCCEKADCASLTWICDVEQLYTDAALMLDASPRVVAAAGSRLIDLHVPLASSTMADGAQQATVLMLGCCEKADCVRVSRGSVTWSSYTQTQRSCYTQTHLGV